MVVVGVLVGIILPSLNKARLKVNAAQCVDQFRQLGTVFSKYSADVEGKVAQATPGPATKSPAWEDTLKKYAEGQGDTGKQLKGGSFWRCPDCRQGHHGVGYNHFLGSVGSIDAIRNPAMTVAFGDAGIVRNPLQSDPDLWMEKKIVGNRGFNSGVFSVPASINWKKSSHRMVNRHLGRASVVFADGHADSIPVSAVGFQYKSGHVRALWDNQ
jgi:prepilin-type processing-associated H-X9-DG protein